MKKTMLIPSALALPIKPTEDLDTAIMPAIINPTTPIPPALIHPLFSGRLPLPPGINGSYKPGGGRNPIVGTRALHQFKNDAALLLSQEQHDWPLIHFFQSSPNKIPLYMEIHFFYRTLWKRDIDGGEKAVIDAVFAHLHLNDNLIVDKHTTKEVNVRDPHVEFEVRMLAR